MAVEGWHVEGDALREFDPNYVYLGMIGGRPVSAHESLSQAVDKSVVLGSSMEILLDRDECYVTRVPFRRRGDE
jgi:hypothetical protein